TSVSEHQPLLLSPDLKARIHGRRGSMHGRSDVGEWRTQLRSCRSSWRRAVLKREFCRKVDRMCETGRSHPAGSNPKRSLSVAGRAIKNLPDVVLATSLLHPHVAAAIALEIYLGGVVGRPALTPLKGCPNGKGVVALTVHPNLSSWGV